MVKQVLLDDATLLLDLEGDFNTVSTAGCPKGLSSIRYIVFRSVPKNFDIVDLDRYCKELANSIGIDHGRATIFLTAVDVTTYSYSRVSYGETVAEAFVTFGIDVPSCANGFAHRVLGSAGTINTAVIVNRPLSQIGLLDLFRLVSEIKGAVVALGGPMCAQGISIGTASDALAVAAPMGKERFAGIATDVGIASATAVINALAKQLRKDSLESYLAKSLGFNSIEDLINIAVSVYMKAPIPCLDETQIRREVSTGMREVLLDPNIVMFVRGLRLLEAVLSLGAIPAVEISEYRADTPGVVVDELAGKALAEYISGFKGLLAYYWVERLKEREGLESLKELPPIADDLVGAIIGSILSRIYDKYSRSCPNGEHNG